MVELERLPTQGGRIVLVVGGVITLAATQFALGMRSPASQIAHVFLGAAYLAPIVLAASWFGWRAGVLCAMATAVLHGVHVAVDWPPDLLLGTTQAVQMSVFVVVAGIVGLLRGDGAGSSTAPERPDVEHAARATRAPAPDGGGPARWRAPCSPRERRILTGGHDGADA